MSFQIPKALYCCICELNWLIDPATSITAAANPAIVSITEAIPIFLALSSVDFRYLIVQPIPNGGKKKLTKYRPVCDIIPVLTLFTVSGISLPQYGHFIHS